MKRPPKNNRKKQREAIELKGTKNILNKIIEENFPNLEKDMPVKVQKGYRTQNKLDERKVSSPYNNQYTKYEE